MRESSFAEKVSRSTVLCVDRTNSAQVILGLIAGLCKSVFSLR